MSAPALLAFVKNRGLFLELSCGSSSRIWPQPDERRAKPEDKVNEDFVTKDTLGIQLHHILAATARPQIAGQGRASLWA